MSETDIENRKAEEESLLRQMELKNARMTFYFEIAKTVLLFIGAIIVFLAIRQPESILNRSASKDTINRERAKLILEWVKEKDEGKREEGLAVINAVYGTTENEWLKAVEFALKQKARVNVATDLASQLVQLQAKLNNEQRDVIEELEGAGGTRKAGMGIVYRAKLEFMMRTKQEIDDLQAKIEKLQLSALYIVPTATR